MESFEKIYTVVSFVPKGKVSTYQQIADMTSIKNPKIVGFALHANKNPKKIPCHRVVNKNGFTAKGYAFGGSSEQRAKLEKEGVCFSNKEKVDLEKFLYKPSKILLLYLKLLFELGSPGKWPWYGIDKTHTKDEIIIGSILTQNTNWKNVQKALENLRKKKANSLLGVYRLGLKNYELLKSLIKPSGYYNQKTQRLFLFCRFIIEEYEILKNFSKLPNAKIRAKLLTLKGIGPETADTILLYALNKPIFVIDNYTKKFTQKYNLDKNNNYDLLQKYFMDNLPKNTKLFQNYHALIIKSMKTKKIKPSD